MGVLDDKVAIVTGSARGIGRATAELLSSQGAKVLINDLDADVAQQTADEIDGETVVYGGDLNDPFQGGCHKRCHPELYDKRCWNQRDLGHGLF